MLTKDDIAFMRATRHEIEANRNRDVIIEYRTGGVRNKITGVVEYGTGTKTVKAITTDRTSRVAAERRIQEQAEVMEGDLWFSILVEELVGIIPKDIIYVTHNGEKYAVVSEDPKGIGEYNRHEFVGKKVT